MEREDAFNVVLTRGIKWNEPIQNPTFKRRRAAHFSMSEREMAVRTILAA